MTFDRNWVLLLSVLPILWAIFEWRRTQRHLALVLKALSFVAILLALAEPHLATTETKVALAVLVDTSASVSPADLDRASQLAAAINDEKDTQVAAFIAAHGREPTAVEVITGLSDSTPGV